MPIKLKSEKISGEGKRDNSKSQGGKKEALPSSVNCESL